MVQCEMIGAVYDDLPPMAFCGSCRIMRPLRLNGIQRMFVAEVCVDYDVNEAARRCGMHPEKGAEMMREPAVAAAIEQRAATREAEARTTCADMIRRLEAWAYGTVEDFTVVGEDGRPYLDFSTVTAEQASAISEITVDAIYQGRGEDRQEIIRVKVKRVDPIKAMEMLARLRGFEPPKKVDVRAVSVTTPAPDAQNAAEVYRQLLDAAE